MTERPAHRSSRSAAVERPSAMMTERPEPMVTAEVLAALLDHLQESGVRVGPLLARHGLARANLRASLAQLPLRTHVRMFEDAALIAHDPATGLRLSAKIGPEVLGALGFLVLSSATLGDALANLARYTAAVQDATETRATVKGDLAYVTYQILNDGITPRAQDAEFSIGCTYRLIRAYVGPQFQLMEVHLEHSALSPLKTYSGMFRCPIYFRQPTNCLVLKAEDLARSSNAVSTKLFPILEAQIRELVVKKAAVSDMTQRVREALSPAALRGDVTAARVAAGLGLSDSTLHRRLRSEGVSFQQLLNERRLDLAKRLLADREMNIAEIAALVGFSEHAVFTRAFQRWTGQTPHAYRKGALQA